MFRLGIHAPTSGATPRFHAAARTLRAEAYLWLPSERPTDAHQYADALHIVRLPNWHVGQTPIAYADACAPLINAWQHIPGVVMQAGNEPEIDVQPGHHGELFPQYAAALRARWPTVKLANPPLQAEHTYLLSAATCIAADYIAVHCYWQIQFPQDIANPNLGMAYDHVLDYDRPVIVTEVNAVPASGVASDTNVDWDERNRQVGKWAAHADGDGVHACCIFIADASDDWKGFDVGPESAAQIRSEYESQNGGGEELPVPPPIEEERPDVVVNASAVVAMAQSQVGHPRSGGYDRHNGDHAWAYWCESFVESTHRNLGLTVQAQRSAVSAAASYNLHHGNPPEGAAVYFGTSFYHPDGHVGISMGDGRLLGTLTDGGGVGYRYWNENTTGFLGWAYYHGVVPAGEEEDPPMVTSLVLEGNPHSPAPDGRSVVLGGGFLRMWQSIDLGGEPLTVLGWPMSNETQARIVDADGSARVRTVQKFERSTLIYDPAAEFPYDVTAALQSQTITVQE